RFPRSAIDVAALQPYCLDHTIVVKTTADHVVLDIFIHKEEPEWIEEGKHHLSPMIPLREAILRGDYRTLYLAWLRSTTLDLGYAYRKTDDEKADFEEEFDDVDADFYEDDEEFEGAYADTDVQLSTPEPPVPPNLNNLSAPLQAFADFF